MALRIGDAPLYLLKIGSEVFLTDVEPGVVNAILHGSSVSSSLLRGGLSVLCAIGGAAQGAASTNGQLAVLTALHGAAQGGSIASADVTILQAIAGTASGSSTATGLLAVQGSDVQLFGEAAGLAGASGRLGVLVGLSGIASGSAVMSAVLSTGQDVLLSGTATGTSLGYGAVVLSVALQGAASGSSFAAATLSALLGLSGSSVGMATTAGTLTVEGGGGGWQPDDVTGLQLWLEASGITGLTDGDPVATWEDQSANAEDFTQGIVAERPTWREDESGETAVRFDGAGDAMTRSGLSGLEGADWTIVFRIRVTSVPGFGPLIFNDSGNAYIHLWGSSQGMTVSDNFGGTNFTGIVTWQDGQWRTVTIRATTGTIEVYVNGTLEGSVSQTRSWPTGSKSMLIGRGTGANNMLAGAFAGILVYDSALSTSDREAAEAYLTP